MDKKILNRLMGLDSEIANKKLVSFADQILQTLKTSKTNEEILEQLELLEQFVYKVPIQTIQIVKHLFRQKPIIRETYKSDWGTIEGKEYNAVIIKCISLLKELRYISFDEVLSLLIKISGSTDKEIKAKAIEALEKVSEYNYHVLLKTGHQLQRQILDILISWSNKKRLQNRDVVLVFIQKILESSFEGSSMKDEKTFVFHRGSLKPTEDLKKIRSEAVNLAFEIYAHTDDLKLKLKLISILRTATFTSDYGTPEEHEKFRDVVKSNIQQIVSKYDELIFQGEEMIVEEPPVVYEIEQQLSLYHINHNNDPIEIENLLKRLGNDHGIYSVYKILAGDLLDFRFDNYSYDDSRKEKEDQIKKMLDSITPEKEDYWLNILNQIAEYKDIAERWKLNHFLDFLARIAKYKPNTADRLLQSAFNKKLDLKGFTGSFLAGFRVSNNTQLWEKYKDKIIKEKNPLLTIGIIDSFEFIERNSLSNVSLEDISLFEGITRQTGLYTFLKKEKNNILLHYSLFRHLLYVYKSNEKKVKPILICEINDNLIFADTYIDQLSYALYAKWIDFESWTNKEMKVIFALLTESRNLDHQALQVLHSIAEKDFKGALNIFIQRIRKSEKIKKGGDRRNLYDPIPYHFEHDFQEYIAKHNEYPAIISSWIKKMTKKWSIYNWEVRQFLEKIGGTAFYQAEIDLINTGKKENLNKVIDLADTMGPPDLTLVLKIVEKTRDKKIWNRLIGRLSATGVVNGEYGIANAHKNLLEQIKKLRAEATNQSIKDFSSEAITFLQEQIEREIKSADEEKAIRKSEFES